MTRKHLLDIYILFGIVITLLIIPNGCFLTRRETPTPTPPPVASSRYNFKLRQPDTFNTLDFTSIQAAPSPIGNTGMYVIERPGLTAAEIESVGGRDNYEWIEYDFIASVPRPDVVDPNEPLEFLLTPNDPMYPQMWGHKKIGTDAAWNVATGTGVIVAVVDTGILCTHPDLAGRCVAGYDFANNDSDPTDGHSHGTHVAGTIAAAGNNGQGVIGIAFGSMLMPIKSLADNGGGPYSAVASGIVWAVDHGAKVINMSFGGSADSNTLREAIDYAWNKGAVLVCAAGNSGSAVPMYPAAYPNCISTAATTPQDTRTTFSNYGDAVDVAAPGTGILSTVLGGQYARRTVSVIRWHFDV
jgi:subtilisin family serine protease